jgi:hypothetical protein
MPDFAHFHHQTGHNCLHLPLVNGFEVSIAERSPDLLGVEVVVFDQDGMTIMDEEIIAHMEDLLDLLQKVSKL